MFIWLLALTFPFLIGASRQDPKSLLDPLEPSGFTRFQIPELPPIPVDPALLVTPLNSELPSVEQHASPENDETELQLLEKKTARKDHSKKLKHLHTVVEKTEPAEMNEMESSQKSTSRAKLIEELHQLIDKFRLRKKDADPAVTSSPSASASPSPSPSPSPSTSSTSTSSTSTSATPLANPLTATSSFPLSPLFPNTNLAAALPSLSSLFPNGNGIGLSSNLLPDVSTLLAAGQSSAFQDPLQLNLGANSLLPNYGAGFPPGPSVSASLNEGRRAQLLQLIKLRSDRIANLQQYVEQGQGVILKQAREFNEWMNAEKTKGDMQLALQKTALQKSEQELDGLVKAQQSDVTELNTYNTQVRKSYLDSGLQLQNGRLQRAQQDEAKMKDEYEKSQKSRKDIEAQVSSLNQELKSLGSVTTTTTGSTGTTTSTTSTTAAPSPSSL